jgi:hypothetical protein
MIPPISIVALLILCRTAKNLVAGAAHDRMLDIVVKNLGKQHLNLVTS